MSEPSIDDVIHAIRYGSNDIDYLKSAITYLMKLKKIKSILEEQK